MSVIIETVLEANRLTIAIAGPLNYESRTAFRAAYHKQPPELAYVIDVRRVPSMDSSALGMLLILRDHAGGEFSDISIVYCQPAVLKLLKAAKFDKLFKIS
ncbi:MAG: STAS domain-containing protein [Magnetococcales bacterium]|nr:STAS domain-containing protein [Magnetococcales bacterium]